MQAYVPAINENHYVTVSKVVTEWLFNDAVSSSVFFVSNYRMINEYWLERMWK
jgi:hypothetical protein